MAVIVNGTEYSWGDIEIMLPGSNIPVNGVTGIEYSGKQEKVAIHARGFKPHKIGRGKKEYSGMVSILQSEFEGMIQALPPGKDLTDLAPAVVTIAYVPEGGVIVTDQLIGVDFSEIKKGMKTGDTHQVIDLPFTCLDIKFNV